MEFILKKYWNIIRAFRCLGLDEQNMQTTC